MTDGTESRDRTAVHGYQHGVPPKACANAISSITRSGCCCARWRSGTFLGPGGGFGRFPCHAFAGHDSLFRPVNGEFRIDTPTGNEVHIPRSFVTDRYFVPA